MAGHPIPREYMDFLREFPNTGMFDVLVEGSEKLSGNHEGWYAISMLFAACTDKRYDLVEITGRPDHR